MNPEELDLREEFAYSDKDNDLLGLAVDTRLLPKFRCMGSKTFSSTGRTMTDIHSRLDILALGGARISSGRPHVFLETDFSDIERRFSSIMPTLEDAGISAGFKSPSPKSNSKPKKPKKHWEHLNKKSKKGRW